MSYVYFISFYKIQAGHKVQYYASIKYMQGTIIICGELNYSNLYLISGT